MEYARRDTDQSRHADGSAGARDQQGTDPVYSVGVCSVNSAPFHGVTDYFVGKLALSYDLLKDEGTFGPVTQTMDRCNAHGTNRREFKPLIQPGCQQVVCGVFLLSVCQDPGQRFGVETPCGQDAVILLLPETASGRARCVVNGTALVNTATVVDYLPPGITAGAANSGGAGFRTVNIPN